MKLGFVCYGDLRPSFRSVLHLCNRRSSQVSTNDREAHNKKRR